NRLAGWVERHPESPGWFFASGYFYRDGARRIYRKREDFYHWCGTSYIARYDLLPLPESGGIERVDSRAFRHFALKEKLARQGAAPLPFPGAVYVQTKRGEATHTRGVIAWTLKHRSRRLLHHAEQSVLNLFRSEPLTPAIAAEFGLYPVSAEKQ
ncbi:MAG TPA: hypothetical protein VKH64_10000, partial [Candidatus Binatia bacterium]|nr:hypothetical protein [Candidatus Binatia bacterium]